MAGWLLLAVLAGGSCLAVFIIYYFIREGIRDDLAYPISKCDTNMKEETLEDKQQ